MMLHVEEREQSLGDEVLIFPEVKSTAHRISKQGFHSAPQYPSSDDFQALGNDIISSSTYPRSVCKAAKDRSDIQFLVR